MPCYTRWDIGLSPGTPEHADAKRRVEAHAEASRHTIDAYLQMYGVEPLSRRRELPFAHQDSKLRPFDLAKLSLGMIHRVAQHCLCDSIGPTQLMDAVSQLSETDRPDTIYRAIMLDVSSAIRRGLTFGPYDRHAYEREDWLIRGPLPCPP